MTIIEMMQWFKYMAVINVALFLLSFVIGMVFKSALLKIHSKMFGISQEQVQQTLYGLAGAYKMAIIVFNVVPYLALVLIQSM